MAIFVYTENIDGTYHRAALEALSYAKFLADKMSESVVAISVNPTESSETLYRYGAEKVIIIKAEGLKSFSARAYARALSEIIDGSIIIFPHSTNAVSVAPILSVIKDAALITNVIEAPYRAQPLEVRRKVFSGKAFMLAKANTETVILTISQNSFGVKENPVTGIEEIRELTIKNEDIKQIKREYSTGKVDLKEAEIVVSAGRGLKDATNWSMIEDLAQVLGAATACSKPVSDIGWRPHSEHVGQTGKNIAPNLYIAVGISGAIQHLAGVNSSKTIVVINNDPEAPFFKSADYGIVGDALQIIPTLTEKIKALKQG